LGYAIHEHEHFMHVDPMVPRVNLEIIRQEMRATHREFHWYAIQGDLDWAENFLTENSSGWALHLRSHVEDTFFEYTDPSD